MKYSARFCLGLLTATTLLAFSACSDDETPAEGDAGSTARAGSEPAGGTSSHTGGATHTGGSGGDGHSASTAECEVLGELCHAADVGPGPVSDCHDLGHVGDAADCHAQFESCINTCVPSEGAGGAGGAGEPHGSAYCTALGELCHAAGEVDPAANDCHDLGHLGNAANCETGFEDCATLCMGVIKAGEGHAGGAGGAFHSGGAGHAGGAGGAH